MEAIFELIFRYFWALAIVVNVFNAQAIWARVQGNVRENPALAPGYRMLANGYAFWMSLPWAVMGFGVLQGGVANMFYFLRPADGNPYVWAFWLTNLVVYGAGTYWLFVGGGIEMLEKHPGFVNTLTPPSSLRFKISWLVQLVGGLAAFAILYYLNLPIEELPIVGQ